MKKDVHPLAEPLPGPRLKQALLSISRLAERDLELLLSCPGELNIHALRVRMKKLSALLPLIEASVSPASMAAIRRDVRALRQGFAENRDQQVVNALLAEFQQSARVTVKAPTAPTSSLPGPRRIHEFKTVVRSLTIRLERLRLRSLSWEKVASAFADTYSKAQRRYERCLQKPAPDRMHRWRKPVKDHYYQALLLLRDRPHCKATRKLGATLGKLHDFSLLREQSREGMPDRFLKEIVRRMDALGESAFRKAKRLLAPAPRKLKNRLRAAQPSRE